MSDLNADPWIQANSFPVGAERLHALGVITLRWNMCEYGLFGVFCEVVSLPIEECWALVHNLGDVAISDRIKALMALRNFHEETAAQVANVIEYYKACNQNRNSLAHAWIRRVSGNPVLARPSKKISRIDPEPFASELEDIRRVANELEILSACLFYLEAIMSESDPVQPLPSRDRLTPPALLWTPPPQVHTKS
jgi:hypothetical protein